jgi:DNA polymerase-3 subunit delta'
MPALLATVRGQPTALETLRRALASGRVHHAYLFDGPNGVGKERAAFGLAQALVCERREGVPQARAERESGRHDERLPHADACGECKACVRAVPSPDQGRPMHPDVVVLERGLYDPAAIGRRSPEVQDISIDQVRTLVLSRAAFPPYEGRARIFIIRRAEELSQSAANALLKTLEEPGSRTHFVLLSSSADALPPTIRSRTQRVRFGRLPEDVIRELLVERGVDPARAVEVAARAEGSMAVALELSDGEATTRRDAFVSLAMAAIDARDLGPALDLAEETKKLDRQAVVDDIKAFMGALATAARATVAAGDRRAEVAALRHRLAMTAVEDIEANAAAQLAVEAMFIKMRAT